MSSTSLAIDAFREAWLSAVRAADADGLASMVTDDVLVVHGDGRCVRGRDELKADFLKAFESFLIDQRVSNSEITIRGDWAFEIADVESALNPVRGGETIRVVTTTMMALRRQPNGAWRVARVVGLLH